MKNSVKQNPKIWGFEIYLNPFMPEDEIRFVQGEKLIGVVTNVGKDAQDVCNACQIDTP